VGLPAINPFKHTLHHSVASLHPLPPPPPPPLPPPPPPPQLSLSPGDLTGALLWSAAMWYASPLQLLLVFLGRIDTERPSDWLMDIIGAAAQLP